MKPSPAALDRIARAGRAALRLAGRERPPGDSKPPPAPPGWQPGPPDFVGIGAQRSGTSWWFDEIAAHATLHRLPDSRKELHFFDNFSNRHLTDADIARYHRWFPRPPGNGITGEWTPCYVYEPWAVPLLTAAAPNARLLLMLRDPFDRFASALFFTLRRNASHSAAIIDAYERGLYASQVARVLAHVPRERLLVLLYEEARESPATMLRRTLEFLETEPTAPIEDVEAGMPHRRQRRIERELAPQFLAELRNRYRDDVEALAKLLPTVDFERWAVMRP